MPDRRLPAEALDQPCPVCTRPCGDHTLREWQECIAQQTTDLPYEQIPTDLADASAANLRRSFGISDDVIVADHVVMRALTLDGASGPLKITFPAVLHEFQVGIIGEAPHPVSRVLFTGDVASIQGYGQLVRDTANGAANAARRAA